MRLALCPDPLPLRPPTAAAPWRVLVSGCIAGWPCGIDGTDNGMGGSAVELLARPEVRAIPFCPEDHALGTPRTLPDLHDGDGFAALAGRARVLDPEGRDLTAAMIAGGRAMVEVARRERVDFAVLTDMSAACGTQVISLGGRLVPERRYQQGMGVAAALLVQAGVPVVSQRDFRTVARLRALAEPGYVPPPGLLDHHQHPWTVATFGAPPGSGAPGR